MHSLRLLKVFGSVNYFSVFNTSTSKILQLQPVQLQALRNNFNSLLRYDCLQRAPFLPLCLLLLLLELVVAMLATLELLDAAGWSCKMELLLLLHLLLEAHIHLLLEAHIHLLLEAHIQAPSLLRGLV